MIVLCVGGMFLTLGDIVMKKWVISSEWQFLVMGMVLWMIGLGCLAASIRHQNIAIASVILIFFNVATLTSVEWVMFGNAVSNFQIAGLILGAIAITMLGH